MTWLQIVAPPLVGAVIGWVTNSLAIRMLFRPHRKWYIGNIPIPLTPGIIPKQRTALAHSIANMVSKQLFTVDTVQDHLRKQLHGPSPSPSDSALAHVAQGLIPDLIQWMQGSSLGRLFPGGEQAFSHWGRSLESYVNRRYDDGSLYDYLVELSQRIEREEPSLENILGPLDTKVVEETVSKLVAPLGGALVDFCRRPKVRSILEDRGSGIVESILNKLSGIQRFFVSVGKYDQQIHDRMPEIVEDTLTMVEETTKDSQVAREVALSLGAWLDKLWKTPMSQWPEQTGLDPVNFLVERGAPLIHSLAPHGSSLLDSSGQQLWKFVSERSLDQILAFILGCEPNEDLEGRVAQLVNDYLGPKGSEAQTLPAPLAQGLSAMVPSVLATFDVRGLVFNRIEALPVEKVEDLLMMVLKKHLKWINVFGALLGALLGAVNLLSQGL